MTNDLRRCPHCGAYVMTGDDICPRCDFDLHADPPPPDEDRSMLPTTLLPGAVEIADLPADADPPAPIDVDQSPAADAESEEAADPPQPVAEGIADAPLETVIGPDLEAGSEAATDLRPDDPDDISELPTLEIPVVDLSPAAPPERSPATPARPPARSVYPEFASPPAEPAPPTSPRTPLPPARKVITPPPAILPPPLPLIAMPPGYGYLPPAPPSLLQQRIDEYRRGGYKRLDSYHANEVVLAYGKPLSVGGWVLALLTIIGAVYYMLLLVLGFLRMDKVYLSLDAAGRLDEDGPGAAHIRHQRARSGRRWAFFGLLIFVFCLVLAVLLGIVAGIVVSQERYQAALREAYPAVTLFEERFSQTEAAPDDVALAHDVAVAYAILAGVALVGVWGGATLWVIGTIHAGAYRVRVRPLPGLR